MSRLTLLHEWKLQVDSYTLRLVAAIPETIADFRASPGQMTTLDLVRHLAEDEWEMIGAIVRKRHLADPRGKLLVAESVITGRQALKDVQTSSDTILRACAESDLDEPVVFPGPEVDVTVAHIVQTMIEHQIHHRGQLITYLRMNGCTVPLRWQD